MFMLNLALRAPTVIEWYMRTGIQLFLLRSVFFLISEPKLQYRFIQMDLYISGACSHPPLYMGSFFSITHPFHYSIIFQESWLYLWISTLTYYHVLALSLSSISKLAYNTEIAWEMGCQNSLKAFLQKK